jgi:hypothetical protein
VVPERFAVYRYEIDRPGEAPEQRHSFAPMKGVGYAGNDEPSEAHPMGNQPAQASQSAPAGHIEAPDGSSIVSFEPPTLEIPGRGRVDVSAVIGATEGDAAELGRLLRLRPQG